MKKIKKSKEEIDNDTEIINDNINEDEQILIDEINDKENIIQEEIDKVEENNNEENEILNEEEGKQSEEIIEDNKENNRFNIEEEENRIIEGYAIVFNELSEDLGGFRELIEPQAVTNELINSSDIFYLYNHNGNILPLARSNKGEGSLNLTIDNKGLKYSFNCLNTEFYSIVQRNDLNKSSFAFSLPVDGTGEKWEKHTDYNYVRHITKIEKLYDCSAVLVPAYAATSVYARSNDEEKNKVDDSYYIQYDTIINKLIKSN